MLYLNMLTDDERSSAALATVATLIIYCVGGGYKLIDNELLNSAIDFGAAERPRDDERTFCSEDTHLLDRKGIIN